MPWLVLPWPMLSLGFGAACTRAKSLAMPNNRPVRSLSVDLKKGR
jgi:hypothetical protein